MNLIFSGLWISNEVIQAICLTLIHSLWQGMLAAIIAGIIIFFSKRSSSEIRYFLLTGIFTLFLVTSLITFIIQFQRIHAVNNISKEYKFTYSSDPVENSGSNSYFLIKKERFIDKVENFSNTNAGYIVTTWFIILLFQCVRLASGIHYIHRIRNRKTIDAPQEWRNKLKEFAVKLRIFPKIKLVQSALIKMPVVIGSFKPVILIPIGLLAKISKEQVEAILLHELAHIKRKDFLVNFFQSIADALFFFNPGFIWISARIREEREACCDEIALSNGIDKHTYLEALVSFQESRMAGNYAMAFGNKRSYLLNRVRKILTRENKKLNYMEKVLLLAGLISITAFGFIGRKNKAENITPVAGKVIHQTKNNVNSKTLIPSLVNDTVPNRNRNVRVDSKRTTIIESDYEGKNYSIQKIGDEITSLTIDGEPISKKDFGKYEKIIRKIEDKEKQQTEMQEADMRQKEREMRMEMDKNKRHLEENEEAYKKDIIERKLEMHKEMIERNRNQREMEEKMRDIHAQMEKLEQMKESGKNNDEIIGKQRQLEKIMEDLKDRQAMDQERMQEKIREMELMQREKGDLQEKYKKIGLSNDDEIHSIIEDLYHHNIITNVEPLSFNLNKNELIVNGKNQSSEVQKEFAEKYIRKGGDLYNYVHEKGSTSITIHHE